MIIENPEFKKDVTTHFDFGEDIDRWVVLPKGLLGKYGATIVMLTNLKYFLEMFSFDDRERYLSPYEILANLEEKVRKDMASGEIETTYLISYKRSPMSDGDVLFDFSHFEVNTETEPDESYRSLYIYFEYSGSAS